MVKLLKITTSPVPSKKLRAMFDDGTHTDFGASGYDDFTTHHDLMRKVQYLARHQARENWSEYKSAGALSRWILWNKPTLAASIKDYKKRFGL
jgi:hypothetical protein